MTNILIGTPCFNGLLTTEYLVSMLGLQRELIERKIQFGLEMTATVSLIPIARNYIVSKVLDNPAYTHLLFIDADLGFEPKLVSRLLAANKDVVAGIYPIKHLDLGVVRSRPEAALAATFNYAVEIMAGAQPTSDGFVRADYAATGFMLIRRAVLERMAAHYADLKYRNMFTRVVSPDGPAESNLYALFDTSIDPAKGEYLPEDYTFCNRWRAMGGEIWVDILSRLTHVGGFAYEGDFSVFVKRS